MYDLVTCLTTTPLRLLSLLGSVIAIGGFSLSVLLIVLRLALGAAGGRRKAYLCSLPSCLPSSVRNSSVVGLLGEYIGRIYNDVRARPRYFVQQVIYPGKHAVY